MPAVNNGGEPRAGEPHVRFDPQRLKTARMCSCAAPAPDPTHLDFLRLAQPVRQFSDSFPNQYTDHAYKYGLPHSTFGFSSMYVFTAASRWQR